MLRNQSWPAASQGSAGTCRDPACCLGGKDQCEPFQYGVDEPPTLGCDSPVKLLDSALQVGYGQSIGLQRSDMRTWKGLVTLHTVRVALVIGPTL